MLLLDYLMPIMEDSYFLEAQVLQFLHDLLTLGNVALIDVAFKTFDLSFNDDYLKKWVMHIMQSCCKKFL